MLYFFGNCFSTLRAGFEISYLILATGLYIIFGMTICYVIYFIYRIKKGAFIKCKIVLNNKTPMYFSMQNCVKGLGNFVYYLIAKY